MRGQWWVLFQLSIYFIDYYFVASNVKKKIYMEYIFQKLFYTKTNRTLKNANSPSEVQYIALIVVTLKSLFMLFLTIFSS
jgi:hypothetical protein